MSQTSERTVVGIEKDLKQAALAKASKDRRTLSAVINIALEEYLREPESSEADEDMM